MGPDLLKADLGVNGTVGLMTVVAVNTGNYVFATALQQLDPILLITNKGSGHGHQIGFALCDKLLNEAQILKAP